MAKTARARLVTKVVVREVREKAGKEAVKEEAADRFRAACAKARAPEMAVKEMAVARVTAEVVAMNRKEVAARRRALAAEAAWLVVAEPMMEGATAVMEKVRAKEAVEAAVTAEERVAALRMKQVAYTAAGWKGRRCWKP